MYYITPYNKNLDLREFYKEAARRGFKNNSSKKAMIDCFKNEKEWNAWILFQDNHAVGSVVAHSFDDVMGPNSYRILSRVCAFAEARQKRGLLTLNRMIREHQHVSDQFFLPECLKWVGDKGNVYATSNASKEASQRLVHSYYFPTLAEMGIVTKIKDVHYRYTDQTVWQIHPEKFYNSLKKYPRWPCASLEHLMLPEAH